jgi:hypothetical protein
MNSHPHGISKLTSDHSRDLLTEGLRRQLAKTAPHRSPLAARQPGQVIRSWASRIVGVTTSLMPAAWFAKHHFALDRESREVLES